jgi:hypothetical protein
VETPAQAIADINLGGNVTAVLGCGISDPDQSGFPAALDAAGAADIVVLMMGIDGSIEGEDEDRTTITLPDVQVQLMTQILALGVPTALVLLNGGMLALPGSTAPAILEAGYPGFFGARAIAQTLFGDNDHLGGKLSYTVYPSGKCLK